MPTLPDKHNAAKRRHTSNLATAARQRRRLYTTSCKRWRWERERQLNRNPLCRHCSQKGRVTAATEVDHINGRADRESDYHPDNYQSLCKSCHSRKSQTERITSNAMEYYTKVYLVSGASGSGKTTYVNQHQKRGDVVIDLDYLYAALSGMALYDKPESLLGYVLRVRDDAIDRIGKVDGINTAWIIQTNPTHSEINTLKITHNAEHIELKVDADECKRRIEADTNRPDELKPRMYELVDHWHETN